MCATGIQNGRGVVASYQEFFGGEKVTVADIGAQDVNGSLKQLTPGRFLYIGVDFQSSKGVDVVLTDSYNLPFDGGSIDIVVSCSCFEHSEMFWVLYLEILRILKPTGLLYLNAPSDGRVHTYPVNCRSFYPDSGQALFVWAKRNGFDPLMLESFTQVRGDWQDYVAVFLRN